MVFRSFSSDIVNLVKNYNTLNVVTDVQSNKLGLLVDNLNYLKDTGSITTQSISRLYKSVESLNNDSLSHYFKSVAEDAGNARVNIVDAYAAILDGNTHGLKNVQSIFNTYNQAFDGNIGRQREFAKAVSQTNQTLGGYLGSLEQGSTADLPNYTKQLVKAKAQTVLLTAKTIALKAVLAAGLSFVVTGIITLVSNFINKQKEAAEKAEELRQQTIENAESAKEEANKISDLISQYEKFKDITSLTAEDKKNLKSIQDQLVETFGREAEGIDLVNGKYDEQIEKLKEASAEKLKNYEINSEELYKTVKKDSDTNKSQDFESGAYYNENGNLFGLNAIMYQNGKVVDNAELINELKNINGVNYEAYGNGIINVDAVGKSAAELSDIYLNILETLKKFSDSEFDFTQTDIYQNVLSNYQHYSEEADATYNAAKSLVESRLKLYELNNGSYQELGREAYVQWIEGFRNEFDSNDKELNKAVEEVISQMNIEVGDYISSQNANNLEIFHSFTDYLKNSEKGLSSYSETISDIISSQEEYSSIIEQQTKDGKLSTENISKLIQEGRTNILEYDNAVKGYKVSVSELNKTNREALDQQLSELQNKRQELVLNYTNSKAQLENLRKSIKSESDYNLYLTELDKVNSEYKESNVLLDLYVSLIENATNIENEYADSIERVNKELENQKTEIEKLESGQSTIDKAIEEQKEFGRLSASSIKALHEAGLGTALAYNEATGETTLLIDSVEELYRAMIKAQEEAAKISMNNLATEIEEITTRLNNFTVNSASDAQKKAELEGVLAEKQNQYSTQQQNIQVISSYKFDFNSTSEEQSAKDAVEEYINSIKEAFDKEKSDLDHLLNMDVISQEEYYNRLFGLNEKYFKGKTELLDEYRQYEEEVYKGLKQKQIDAIQEQIDALKSVNEEKQEEIDLEKAKQALENAKRNKIISVYDSERGWIHETDRKAIDTAQKEYDDLVLNEKIEALESMIDAIENGTNTNHSLDESIDVIQQVGGMVDLTKYFKNVDTEMLNEMTQIRQSIYNGAGIPEFLTNQFDKTIPKDSYVVNDNKTINLNGVTVKTDDPERFVSQMEQIANKSFDDKFMPAMNNLAEDIKRHRANHRYY